MEFTDQMGRTVSLKRFPRRIISLVPSQTELLYDLGIQPVGQTLFCVKPEHAFSSSIKVGGTKRLNINRIRALAPDLIIGNKEENDREQIETLASEFPVWMSDIYTLDDARQMILPLGDITGQKAKAKEIDAAIELELQVLKALAISPRRVLYLIWYHPFMAAGQPTFIHDVMQHIPGWQNVLPPDLGRYPQLSASLVRELDPELILLSSEPFPFRESHVRELQLLCPDAQVIRVAAEPFSWYGSQIPAGLRYLQQFAAGLNRS